MLNVVAVNAVVMFKFTTSAATTNRAGVITNTGEFRRYRHH